jgi:succinylglutamic semialdehyde dehydrogenase
MGPVISKAAAGNVLKAQAELISRGGLAIKRCEGVSGDSGGAMVTPGLIDVSSVKERADVEVFGPLLQLIRVSTFDEAIRVANDTRYGLAAGLLCEDRAKYETFYRRIRAGVINWNKPTTGASAQLPFGGVGRSGNHRPAGYFVADACSYALAAYESEKVTIPASVSPGVSV